LCTVAFICLGDLVKGVVDSVRLFLQPQKVLKPIGESITLSPREVISKQTQTTKL
jgi:hypothetical protein